MVWRLGDEVVICLLDGLQIWYLQVCGVVLSDKLVV